MIVKLAIGIAISHRRKEFIGDDISAAMRLAAALDRLRIGLLTRRP